jgi:hypothetical protein
MKDGIVKFLLTIIWITAASVQGWCQVMIPQTDDPPTYTLFIHMGLEPEWVITAGYNRRCARNSQGVRFYVGASLKMAPLLKEAGRINFIQSVHWKYSQHWKGILNLDLYFVHSQNRAGIMNGLGTDLRTAILHQGNTWVKGIEAGWQYTAFTHIKHSAQTKETFRERYPPGNNTANEPVDGWYGATASRFRLGFTGSKKLSNHLSVQTSLGSLVSVQKQGIFLGFSHAQVPFYFHTQFTYGW